MSAAPATTPPTAKPALRSAPRKPNHFSRSPGGEMTVTIGEYEPQNAVRPITDALTTSATDQTWSTNGYSTKLAACRALPDWRIVLEPNRSTCCPTSTAAGSDSSEASDSARPTCTSGRSVVARKKIIDTGIQTPEPTASMPIAVTKRRWRPTSGNPSLWSIRPIVQPRGG